MTDTKEKTAEPVRCSECAWCGYSDELGAEGECGGEGCSSSSVHAITDHSEMIEVWLDSEGAMCGKELADAGMIEPRPATAEEAVNLDVEPGDTVWDLTAAGEAELAKAPTAPSAE